MASTYCLKVGDKRLEIGAFSIEMTAVGISGFVKAKYNATFAPLTHSARKNWGQRTLNVLLIQHYLDHVH